jgi:lipoprotein-anchoring transpeptidase ErfK/SrfK
MRRRTNFLFLLPLAGIFFAPNGALGQNYGGGYPYAYDGGRGDSDYYGEPDPYYGDFDRPTRARPRRGLADDRDPYDEYGPDRAPAANSRAARRPSRLAALPPDADPAYSTPLDFDGQVDPNVSTRALVDDPTGQPAGTITIDTARRKLYLSLGRGEALEYGVGVGRQGFAWKGAAQIGRKAFWPGWTPPKEMLLRRPDLPDHMDGGLDNPLGARALYLFKGSKDTLFRIHGTNEPDTIGQAVSSGCIRMLNADVIDLYRRVSKGARVVVL